MLNQELKLINFEENSDYEKLLQLLEVNKDKQN